MALSSQEIGISTKENWISPQWHLDLALGSSLGGSLGWLNRKQRQNGWMCVSQMVYHSGVWALACGGKCLSGQRGGQRTVWRRGELICRVVGKKWKNREYPLAPISTPPQFPAFQQTQREVSRVWGKGLSRRRRSKWMWEGRDPQGWKETRREEKRMDQWGRRRKEGKRRAAGGGEGAFTVMQMQWLGSWREQSEGGGGHCAETAVEMKAKIIS